MDTAADRDRAGRDRAVVDCAAEAERNRDGVSDAPSPIDFVLLLFGVGLLLTIGTEFAYLIDSFGYRMNTVFKFYYQAWALVGSGSAFAAYYLIAGRETQHDRARCGGRRRRDRRRAWADLPGDGDPHDDGRVRLSLRWMRWTIRRALRPMIMPRSNG